MLSFLLLLSLVPARPSQDAREPVVLAPEGNALAVATDGELSAAAWRRIATPYGPSDEVRVSISDGRGLAWSAPALVDEAPPGVPVSAPRIVVAEERAYVAWHDRRHGPSAAFLRATEPGGVGLGPEVEIPLGPAANLASVVALALDVERAGAQVRVHVALLLRAEHADGTVRDEVRLLTSVDGGATFGPPLVRHLPLALLDVFDPPLAVQAEGGIVHVLWMDPRTSDPQVFYQRSSDAGATFDFADDRQLTALPDLVSFRFDARGSTLALATWQARPWQHGYEFSDVSAAVSSDGGATFGAPVSVPLADPVTVQSHHPAIAVGSGDVVLLAWGTGMLGVLSPQAYVARTTDGGATWSGETRLSESLGQLPELAAAGPGRERVVAAWLGEGYFPVGWKPYARLSVDGGATWASAVTLGAPSAVRPIVLAFNDRYQNLIALWNAKDEPHPVVAGGFRPQTLAPAGFTAGPTQVGATFERFDDGAPLALLVLSTAPGDLLLPLGDARVTGLGPAPLLWTSAALAAGPFAAPLDGAGGGALAPLPATLPSPLTLYALGVAFDPAMPAFGDLSDVVRIDL